MRWLFLSVLVACCVKGKSQDSPARSKVMAKVSQTEARALERMRESSEKELESDNAAYIHPDIAKALGESRFLIAVARVTSVNVAASRDSRTTYTLQVEEPLRGTFTMKTLHAESRWFPHTKEEERYWNQGGPHRTIFDLEEPRVEGSYVIGYTFLSGDQDRAYVSGGFDLGDAAEAHVWIEVQRFLSIEKSAGADNTQPYLAALTDSVPWIRDLAAGWLTRPGRCAGPCLNTLLSAAHLLLESKRAGDRYEALGWLEPLAMGRIEHQSSSKTRDLLVSAAQDANLVVGDKAFYELATYDFFDSSPHPGDCVESVPALRRSAVWTADEEKGAMIGGPLGLSLVCVPSR